MTVGIAILRAVVGGLFIGHGLQKLNGWFGGYGIEGTGGWMESVGLYPGKHHATAGGLAEAAGGAMLVAGLGTPAATAALTAVAAVLVARFLPGRKAAGVGRSRFDDHASTVSEQG